MGILSRTELRVEHVTIEARDSQGAMNSVGARAEGEEIVTEERLASGLGMRHLSLVGVVMLQGRVPASGLAALVDDSRVYMVDTLHRALARNLAEWYGVGLEQVDVWAPSPFWSLSVEREAL